MCFTIFFWLVRLQAEAWRIFIHAQERPILDETHEQDCRIKTGEYQSIRFLCLTLCDHIICISLGLGIRTDTGCILLMSMGRKDGLMRRQQHNQQQYGCSAAARTEVSLRNERNINRNIRVISFSRSVCALTKDDVIIHNIPVTPRVKYPVPRVLLQRYTRPPGIVPVDSLTELTEVPGTGMEALTYRRSGHGYGSLTEPTEVPGGVWKSYRTRRSSR